ncbi:MAG TPA: DNA-formamidopyrimidine glycosylase family protein [Marmoricola sp.]|nr:DNA-formamidopyrimidine glycosylase family protein [Marmoricola sp.]
MPEGDTVWRTAKHLDQALSGQVLTATDFRVPAFATLDLSGHVVKGTVARGKHLLTRIGEEHTLHTHLKMEGSWHLYRPGTGWRRPSHEARVVLHTQEWIAVGFALGITEVIRREEEGDAVGHLGPDLLGPDWDEDEALRRLLAAPERPVGEALLDQRNLAGIGTIYRAETLFVAGVSPFLDVAAVPDLVKVVRVARRMMMANRERTMQVTTGMARRGEHLWVYGRGGKPCRRCRTRIRSGRQGAPPLDRIIYWCPTCQPAQHS